jgi:uncharacterized protein
MKKKYWIPAMVIISGLALSVILLVNQTSYPGSSGNSSRVLLITGGHGFDKEFYSMIFSLGDMRIDTLVQPAANQSLLSDSIDLYDVILFYDMWQAISGEEKKALLRLTEMGTGLVFLHHSLVSYQSWPLFTQIRGGKYYERGHDYPPEKLSAYKHDIVMRVKVIDPSHPVTQNLDDFEIHDEGYSNIEVLQGVTPLLSTDHPDCSDIIGWTNFFNNSKVVYILLGHDNNAWSNENFKKLVYNAINWTGK